MYTKVDLPYKYDDLAPYISATTVETHYSKHLQGYVEKLNGLLESWGEWDMNQPLESLLANPEKIPVGIRQGVINNGGGVYNHNLYFSILSPIGSTILIHCFSEQYGRIPPIVILDSKHACNSINCWSRQPWR